MDRVSGGPLHRRAAVLRSGRRAVSAIGLSPVVALLGGPRRGAGRRCRNRHRAAAAGGHRLSQFVLRPARGRAPQRNPRRRGRADAAESARHRHDSHRRPHRVALVGGPQSRSAERAAVCAAGVGRFAATAGHHRADAQAPRQRARRHQRDEARVSAIPRRRRRDAAAGDPAGDFPGRLLAAAAEVREAAQSRSVSSWRRWWRRNRISIRWCARMPTPTG